MIFHSFEFGSQSRLNSISPKNWSTDTSFLLSIKNVFIKLQLSRAINDLWMLPNPRVNCSIALEFLRITYARINTRMSLSVFSDGSISYSYNSFLSPFWIFSIFSLRKPSVNAGKTSPKWTLKIDLTNIKLKHSGPLPIVRIDNPIICPSLKYWFLIKYSGINFKPMLLLSPKIIPGIRLKVAIANVRNSLSGPPRSAAASPAKRTKIFSWLRSNVCFRRRCQNRSGSRWIIICLHCSFLLCTWKSCFAWLIKETISISVSFSPSFFVSILASLRKNLFTSFSPKYSLLDSTAVFLSMVAQERLGDPIEWRYLNGRPEFRLKWANLALLTSATGITLSTSGSLTLLTNPILLESPSEFWSEVNDCW